MNNSIWAMSIISAIIFFFSSFIFIIPIILIILGIYIFIKNLKKLKKGNYCKTIGVITDYDISKAEDKNIPVIEYCVNNKMYNHAFNIDTLKKEKKIKIIYNKNNPKEAELYHNNFILSFIFIFVGVFILMLYFFKNIALVLIFLIFIVSIVFMLIEFIKRRVKAHSKKYKEIEGMVISYHKDIGGTDTGTTYFENIEYIINGKNYYYRSPISASFGSKVGKKRILKYNPSNPLDCVIKKISISEIIIHIFMVFMLYLLIRFFLLLLSEF